MKPKQNAQACACQWMLQALGEKNKHHTTNEHKEKAFIQHCTQGLLRWQKPLGAIADKLGTKPVRHPTARMLLLLGLYQLFFMSIPDKKAIYQTVEAADQLGIGWAKKMLNACLRRALRESDCLKEHIALAFEQGHTAPTVLQKKIHTQWPKQATYLMHSYLSPLPLNLRINTDKISIDAFKETCAQKGILLHPSPITKDAFVLGTRQSATSLPGFNEGWYYLQDIGAQLTPSLMQTKPGMKGLDACAGKGGKTFHLAQSAPESTWLATDIKGMKSFEENKKRLGIGQAIYWQQHDWQNPHPTLKGPTFDRILADVPCSASGIIGRHPEILWKKREQRVHENQALQLNILKNLWPLLKPGGYLLYVTCSLFQEENDDVVTQALACLPNMAVDTIAPDWGEQCAHGQQLLPSEHHAGFYFSRLKKEKNKG